MRARIAASSGLFALNREISNGGPALSDFELYHCRLGTAVR
jgi:hypothetical protein